MTVIYEPRGRAREYAALATNVYTRCDHGCLYCYVPSATMQSRDTFIEPKERPNYLCNLENEAKALASSGEEVDQILLCFTSDAYQYYEMYHKVTRKALEILKEYDLNFCVLTKGGARALRDISYYGAGDSFSSTLTFIDEDKSLYWEPGAALPADRINTLKTFHRAGIETWVSLEPVIEPSESLNIILETAEFVDLYKVGRMNHHEIGKTIDWSEFGTKAIEMLESLGKHYYIKVPAPKGKPKQVKLF